MQEAPKLKKVPRLLPGKALFGAWCWTDGELFYEKDCADENGPSFERVGTLIWGLRFICIWALFFVFQWFMFPDGIPTLPAGIAYAAVFFLYGWMLTR